MYSPELLEKKKKKLSRIAVFAIILSLILFLLPKNFTEEYSPSINGYFSTISDILNEMLSTGNYILILSLILILSPIICLVLFFFSILTGKPSAKLKLMSVAFIFFLGVCLYFGVFTVYYEVYILKSLTQPFEYILLFLSVVLILYLPFLISYLRTRKYFVKNRKAEKKEEKQIKTHYAEPTQKQKIKTTVTQDEDICIHIEFV